MSADSVRLDAFRARVSNGALAPRFGSLAALKDIVGRSLADWRVEQAAKPPPPTAPAERGSPKLRGFVSYAHANHSLVETFLTHLRSVEFDYLVSFWIDEKLQGGDRWDPVIGNKITESDFCILLLSPDFLSRPYIRQKEIPLIKRREADDGLLVIPVLLQKCQYVAGFGHYQCLPTAGGELRAIVDWRPIHDGHHRAVEQIIETLSEKLGLRPLVHEPPRNLTTVRQDKAAMAVWFKDGAYFAPDHAGTIDDKCIGEDPYVRRQQEHVSAFASTLASACQTLGEEHALARSIREIADALAPSAQPVWTRIKLIHGANRLLVQQKNIQRVLKITRSNNFVGAVLLESVDSLVQEAGLWLRQFPTVQKLDDSSLSPADVSHLLIPALRVLEGASSDGIIAAGDVDPISQLLVGEHERSDQMRAVMAVRNLLYGIGAFALGFTPKPVTPGALEDARLAKKVEFFLFRESEAIAAIVTAAPPEVGEAFRRLIEICNSSGLEPPTSLTSAPSTASPGNSMIPQVMDVAVEARRLMSQGDAAQDLGDLEAARGYFEQAILLYRRVGDVQREARCIGSLGYTALCRADYDGTRTRYEEALSLFRRVGDEQGAANCIQGLGKIALRRTDHDGARARFEEALLLYRRVGDVLGEANCMQGLGAIALDRSDHDGARARYEEALPLCRRVGDVLGEANCIQRLGYIALARSDHDGARARFEEALPLYRRVGSAQGEANCLIGHGRVARALGDTAVAKTQAEAALALFQSIHATHSVAIAHEDLAAVTQGAERAGHVAAAAAVWRSMGLEEQATRVERRFAANPGDG